MHPRSSKNFKEDKTLQERKPASRGQAVRHELMIVFALVGLILLMEGMTSHLDAQSYPDKPIRFILPQNPGGVHDLLGRIIAQKLSEELGQPLICENRAGSGGNIGTAVAAKARPDGYTIVLVSAALSYSPSLYKKLNYDPIGDFAPISLVADVPVALLIQPSRPFMTLKELVEYAKANPGKLNFGSGGVGSANHLHVELFKSLTKINIVNVPFKGAGPALTGLMGGEIDLMITAFPSALPHIQSGKLKALAVMSHERLRSLPDVPTAREAGIDNFNVSTWYGIMAPAGTPSDIVNRLSAAWSKVTKMPDTLAMLQKAGLEPLSCTPDQFSEYLKAEVTRWSKIIKDVDISLN
jgi:tripartite-type tricarboxylate transporter receptor subunit TctC